MPLYPLKFRPRSVEKIWGGSKIQEVLGKKVGPGKIGESWELYDFPPGVVAGENGWVSSEIANGPLAGRALHWAIGEFGDELMGNVASGENGQFPLLVKFLDAREDLSVQVHPHEEYCAKNPNVHLKTEAWYVMEAEQGARIYRGLKAGTTKDQFRQAIEAGKVEEVLNSLPVKAGQSFYLPSGTVHALGAGILVAEVQTPSDTTFRVYDFERVDEKTGKKRALHVKEAMECIEFPAREFKEPPRSHVAGLWTTVSRLVTSPFFTMEKVRFVEGVEEPVPYDQPVVWIMLEGQAEIRVEDMKEPVRFTKGEVVLIPARMKGPLIKTLSSCAWLEVTFPAVAGNE